MGSGFRFFLQSGFNVSLQRLGLHGWRRSVDNLALVINQERLEVPRDVTGFYWAVEQDVRLEVRGGGGTVTLQKGVQRVLLGAIHVYLPKHLEVRHEVVARVNILDSVQEHSGGSSWFLVEEYVAGKTQNYEALAAILGIKCIQSQVMRRHASVGGEVHDQNNLAPVVTEADVLRLV